jgi:hypothetical protein
MVMVEVRSRSRQSFSLLEGVGIINYNGRIADDSLHYVGDAGFDSDVLCDPGATLQVRDCYCDQGNKGGQIQHPLHQPQPLPSATATG